EATAASISWLIATMSKVCGARYSAVSPSSWAAAVTPLATTDQNGSDACPCVTTTMRKPFWLTAPLVFPVDWEGLFPPPLEHAAATTARSSTAAHTRRFITPPPLQGRRIPRRPHPPGRRGRASLVQLRRRLA